MGSPPRTEAGQRLYEWRKLHGLSCSCVGNKAGVPGLGHRLLRWEWGECELTEEEMEAVRKVVREWKPADVPWWAH